MRIRVIYALSLLLSGCASITTSGTEEALLFSGKEASAEKAQRVLKPYNDLPLSIEFACPDKIAALSTFYVIPLPPVVPVGFVNEPISYLRVRMPEGVENAMAHLQIVTAADTAIPLTHTQPARRALANDGSLEVTYTLNKNCEALNGGMLEVAGFSYRNKHYPASEARLHFESRIRTGVAWWPPMLLNKKLAATGETEASKTPAQ